MRDKIKNLLLFLIMIYLLLFVIALAKKDKSKNEFSRFICKEFVNGPRNILALIVNKIKGKTLISYKTKIMTTKDKSKIFDNGVIEGKKIIEKEKSQIKVEKKNEVLEKQIIKKIEKNLKDQDDMEKLLLEELKSKQYTLIEPYIILDPYNESPLTALVLFVTDEPVATKIKIEGKDTYSELEYDFRGKGYIKEHILPIYGLYPQNKNKVTITTENLDKKVAENVVYIETKELNSDLKNTEFIVYSPKPEKYETGFNFSYSGLNSRDMKKAFDINGEIRWYLKSIPLLTVNYNKMNSIFICEGNSFYGDAFIIEKNLLGKILTIYYTAHGIHHDIHIGKDELIITGSNSDGTIEDIISGINLKNGLESFVVDYKKILSRSRDHSIRMNSKDWIHLNAVVEIGEDIIVSSNHQSSIIKNDKKGNLIWIFGDPIGYTSKYKEYLLKPIGKNFEYPYNQHSPMILPDLDKNSNTIDILLFDNGTSRNYLNLKLQEDIKLGKRVKTFLYSKISHYRIDEVNKTVELLWDYGKEREELFSPFRGDADFLNNGNFLGVFNREKFVRENLLNDSFAKESYPRDYYFKDTFYIEVDKNKNIIWECQAVSRSEKNIYFDYRIERLPIYTETANDIKLGVPAKNLIPKEVYEKYGLKKEET